MVDLATGRGAASLLRHKFSSLTARFQQDLIFFWSSILFSAVNISTALLSSPAFLHSIQIDICPAHAVSQWQDEAVHGRAQLVNSLGSFVLLGLLLGDLALLESAAGPAVHLLGQWLQVLWILFGSISSNHLCFRQLKILDINRTNYPKRTIDASGEVDDPDYNTIILTMQNQQYLV